MSFIAITYGYNQFSIFNTNVSTLPLIDNIVHSCLDDILSSLDIRLKSLTKELEDFTHDEENLKKNIKKLEGDKQREEEKQFEANKSNDSSTKDIKKAGGVTKIVPNKSNNNKLTTSIDNSPILLIVEEMKGCESKLQVLTVNREKVTMKKKLLIENKEKYDAYDKKSLKIDLVDGNGDRINIHMKGDAYANLYLVDKQCYELHKQYNSKFEFIN
jgi:hypothetical protein